MTAYPWLHTFAKATSADREEVDRLAALVSQWTTRIRRAFVVAVARIADKIDLDQLAELLRQGRGGQALDLVNAALQQGGFAPVAAASTDAVLAAGRDAAQTPALGRLEASFGVVNPTTIAGLQTYEFGLVRELTDAARASVKQAVTDGVSAGRNPLDTARDVRAAVGLTATQSRAVSNFRRALEQAPQDALDRALRDKRYDPTIARAVREQATIAPDKIDDMVERYRQRYLKYRSEMIARTESIRAVNFGNMETWRQAIADGRVAKDAVTKRWIYTQDEKTRHAHRTIPSMNPVDPAIDQPFKSELGPILYPGDPNAAAANVIHCRCTVVLRYKPQREPPPPQLVIEPPKPPRKPRAPPKPKPPPVPVPPPAAPTPTKIEPKFYGTVSQTFKNDFLRAIEAQPKGAKDALLKAGIQARGSEYLVDVRPELKGVQPPGWSPGSTWDMVEGCYGWGVKRLDVAEMVKTRSGGSGYGGRTAHVTAHEFGHALDDALGNPSTTDPAFLKAYDADVASYYSKGGKNEPPNGYFLQTANFGWGGRAEMFAEQWAERSLHYKEREDSQGNRVLFATGIHGGHQFGLRLQFPEVASYIDQLHASLKT